jgi:hypothetical protein
MEDQCDPMEHLLFAPCSIRRKIKKKNSVINIFIIVPPEDGLKNQNI